MSGVGKIFEGQLAVAIGWIAGHSWHVAASKGKDMPKEPKRKPKQSRLESSERISTQTNKLLGTMPSVNELPRMQNEKPRLMKRKDSWKSGQPRLRSTHYWPKSRNANLSKVRISLQRISAQTNKLLGTMPSVNELPRMQNEKPRLMKRKDSWKSGQPRLRSTHYWPRTEE